MAILEDKVADTSTVYDILMGEVRYSGKVVRDSHKGGYGKISLARGFELSIRF
jgi:cell division protein FtsI (penicillin-binding protein 3)